MIRRELLARGAAATATAGTVLSWPARAVGMARAQGAPRCDRDRDCPRGTVCRSGRCACTGYEPDRCAGKCTNFDVDPSHCGGCNRQSCAFEEYCYGGRCISTSGDSNCAENCSSTTRICCQGQCVGVGFDTKNCGGCGIECGPGQTCCWGRCIDPRSDARYCGGCETEESARKCGPNQVCHAGRCRDECPPRLRQCGQRCGNPNTQVCCGRRDLIDKDDIANGLMKCCNGRATDVTSTENCGTCGCECVTRGDQECTCRNGECDCGPGTLGCRFFQP